MEEKTLCDICKISDHEKFNLTCKHSLCIGCIYKLFIFNKKLICSSKKDHKINLNCLKCEKGHLIMSKIEILDYLNRKINSEVKRNCNDHNLEIKYLCVKCDWSMCEECKRSHSAISAFAKHQIENDKRKISALKKNNIYCTEHKNSPLTYFCLFCKEFICDICKNVEHSNHEIEYIEYYKKNLEDFKNEAQSLKNQTVKIWSHL